MRQCKNYYKKKYSTTIYDSQKSNLQDIFAYIKDTRYCETITTHKALALKEITAEHKHTTTETLYKYNAKFISKKENIQQIVQLIALSMANAKILEKNKSLHDTEEQIPLYLNLAKISATQYIIKKIILSLLQTPNISYIEIIEEFDLILQKNIELINEHKNNKNPKQIIRHMLQSKTYKNYIIQNVIKEYEPTMQKITQEQETYFTDNETAVSEEPSATVEAETRAENIKHSHASINLQDTTTQTPSSKQEQPRSQQLIAITQQKKRKGKYLLDAEHEIPHKKQYKSTGPQKSTTLITEITSVQQNKVAHSQRQ